MAVNGLVFSCNTYRLFAESNIGSTSSSMSGAASKTTPIYIHSGTLSTGSTPDIVNVGTGFYFSFSGTSNTDTWSVFYDGPGAPLGGITWTGAGYGSISVEAVLTDLKLYDTGGAWLLTADYEIIAQGVTRFTGSIATPGGGFGPAYIPLIGIPVKLSGGSSASITSFTADRDDPYNYTVAAAGSVQGGWGFDIGDGEEYLDVARTGSVPSAVGSCDNGSPGSVGGTDTGSLTISSNSTTSGTREFEASGAITACTVNAYCDNVLVYTATTGGQNIPWDVYKTTHESQSGNGTATAVPNLDKFISRINDDYLSLWYREKMPQVLASSSATCNYNGSITTSSSTPEVYAGQDVILEDVGNSTASCEDTLGFDTYMPWSAGASRSKSISFDVSPLAAICPVLPVIECEGVFTSPTTLTGGPPPYPSESYSSSQNYSFPSAVATGMAGYLSHDQDLPRYINSWCNPLWSYFLWTQNWEVDGSPETWNDYWAPIGQQHIYNSAASITNGKRNFLISEPGDFDSHAGFGDTYLGGLRFLGICKWFTNTFTPRESYSYTSSSSGLWTGDSLSFGSTGITVSSPGKVKLRLGSLTEEPYLWPHMANEFVVSFTGTGDVYLEDVNKRIIPLGSTGGTYNRAKGPMAKYVGSHAQDYEANFVNDFGYDSTGLGRSSAAMNDVELKFAPSSSAGFGAKYLVYNLASTGVIYYPELNYNNSSERYTSWESPYQVNVVADNSCLTRFGVWYTGDNNTITFSTGDPKYRCDAVSWLCQAYMCLLGEQEDVDTELSLMFNSFEGQAVGQNRNSYAFLLPNLNNNDNWEIAVVNSYRECPPLGIMPQKARDNDWLATGDWCQGVYSYIQGNSYALTSSGISFASTTTGSTILASPTTVASGWQEYLFGPALNNSEGYYHIVVNTEDGLTTYGRLRPWRGFSFIHGDLEASLASVCGAVTSDRFIGFAYTGTGGVVLDMFDDGMNYLRSYNYTGEECSVCSFEKDITTAVTTGNAINLFIKDELMYSITTDSGTNPCIVSYPDGHYRVYWLEDDEVYTIRLDNAFNLLLSKTLCTGLGSVDEIGVGAVIASNSSGRPETRLAVIESDNLVVYTSVNGVDFT